MSFFSYVYAFDYLSHSFIDKDDDRILDMVNKDFH